MFLRQTLNFLHDLLALIPRRAWGVLAFLAACSIIYTGTRANLHVPSFGFRLPHQDKVLHFLAYSLFASLIFRAIYPFPADAPPARRGAWLAIAITPFLVGSLDEFLQGYTPGRSQDLYDLLVDSLAGIVVCMVALHWRRVARRRMARRR